MDDRIARWLSRDPDARTRAELQALVDASDAPELARRFAGRLAFGTAGLRGVVGAGPARMNRLVIRETSAGLGRYLLASNPDAPALGVVVGYDGRLDSRLFAEDTAATLAALGFTVYLTDRPVPTPLCAFAVTHLGAAAGVVVTASHNPPEYNGYKVYWANGAQIIAPHDAGIAAAIDEAAAAPLPWMSLDDALEADAVRLLDDTLIEAYLDEVSALSVHPDHDGRDRLVIAYTPLHGVGAPFAEAALARAGFSQVHTVASQRDPDGRFPTVRFPNPEEPGATDALLDLARRVNAHLALANDPDADRLAVAVPDPAAPDGWRLLSGDQVGVLLGADRIEAAHAHGAVATTIVSSQMLGAIARAHGAAYFETLTGFKWIANAALDRARHGERFLFGYEEALGYTVGDLVHDKDGVSALVSFAELAAALRAQGLSILDRLEALERAHGIHATAQRSLALDPHAPPGPSLGDLLRAHDPAAIAGRTILTVLDMRQRTRRDRLTDHTSPLDLPPSDVLVYLLEGDARVIVRPSGTEPKVKCYYELRHDVAPDQPFAEAQAQARAALSALIDAHQQELAVLQGSAT